MLQNAYWLAKIGADTAENERNFAENLPKIGNYPTGPLPYGSGPPRSPRVTVRWWTCWNTVGKILWVKSFIGANTQRIETTSVSDFNSSPRELLPFRLEPFYASLSRLRSGPASFSDWPMYGERPAGTRTSLMLNIVRKSFQQLREIWESWFHIRQ